MFQRLLIAMIGFLVTAGAPAATYQTTDGRILTGEPVGFSNRGLVMKLGDGSYEPAVPWAQLSQETLKELRDHPKAGRYVEPFIRLTEEERKQRSGLTLADVPRLDRPAGQKGMVGMLFASGIGWFLMFLVYLGNLFAAYEVALYRAYSPQAVCAAAAVLPWITQGALLAVPRETLIGAMGGKAPPPPMAELVEEPPAAVESAEAALAAGVEPEALPPGETYEEGTIPPEAQSPLLPDSVTYSRGVVTFNRRFFESKRNAFMKVVPPDSAKDMVVLIKTSRGDHLTNYLVKLEQTEMRIRVTKGDASEEVRIPYLEIFEVQVKHRDLV